MIELSACLPCLSGFHEECADPAEADDGTLTCCCERTSQVEQVLVSRLRGHGEVGRPAKDLADIVDVTSAGRKRAAQIAPILTGMMCEWAGLRYAGGGVVPMIGCRGNRIQEKGGVEPELLQGDRHHGPLKSTLMNNAGNLHRVCAECHHRWHAINDRYYDSRPGPEDPYEPRIPYFKHDDRTKATEQELEDSDNYWALSPEERNKRPYEDEFHPDIEADLVIPGTLYGGRYAYDVQSDDPFEER